MLGSDVTVEEVESKVSLEVRFTQLCALKHQKKGAVFENKQLMIELQRMLRDDSTIS